MSLGVYHKQRQWLQSKMSASKHVLSYCERTSKQDEILTQRSHHELPEEQVRQVQTRYHCRTPADPTSHTIQLLMNQYICFSWCQFI